MGETFFPSPEFTQWYSESQLLDHFGIRFKESGWYELSNGDVILVIERLGKYRAWTWLKTDPREEIEKCLDLSKFNVNDD